MLKIITRFSCRDCGASFPRWQGQCGDCGGWNSLDEIREEKSPAKTAAKQLKASIGDVHPVKLADVKDAQDIIVKTGLSELDRVLGDGIVEGSAVLLGGEPGIGKSTLSLQLASQMAASGKTVLYVSGEESLSQLSIRSKRLGADPERIFLLTEVNIMKVLAAIETSEPDVVILDSIQVMNHPQLSSISGSVAQVRQCAQVLIEVAKKRSIPVVLIGHITKDGNLAGPKVLEHLVDVILVIEGERDQDFRLLRCFKNRYASANEIGLFSMKAEGLVAVDDTESLFLGQVSGSGTVVAPVLEGSRVMMVEVQALVSPSGFGMAKRTFLGVDAGRANFIIAVIEKMLKIPLSKCDIILNVVGGLKIAEPAMDLAMVLAILSSFKEESYGEKVAAFGEIGLSGEVRPVAGVDKRLKSISKMGFKPCFMPKGNGAGLSDAGSVFRLLDHISMMG